jgi:hypothetical protein
MWEAKCAPPPSLGHHPSTMIAALMGMVMVLAIAIEITIILAMLE